VILYFWYVGKSSINQAFSRGIIGRHAKNLAVDTSVDRNRRHGGVKPERF
jgi:hypothetical protein